MNDSKLYSQEAEQSVLGAIMLDEIAFDIVIEVGLQASHFYGGNHKLVFEAITHLSESAQPTDVVTVAERLDVTGNLEAASGAAYLSRMVDITPSIDNAKAYAEIIIDRSRRRSLVALSGGIRAKIDEGAETEEVEAYVNDELNKLSDIEKAETLFSSGAAAKQLLNLVDDRANGKVSSYKTGIDTLDDILMIEGSRLYIIAGRPGMGKSTLALNVGERNAMPKHKKTGRLKTIHDIDPKHDDDFEPGVDVCVHSMEMPAPEVSARTMVSIGDVDRDFLKYPNDPRYIDQWKVLSKTVNLVKDLPLSIETKRGRTAAQICNSFRTFCRKSESYQKHGKAMLIVDYLGLIKQHGESRVKSLGEATKLFKNLAGELNVPVILLHQLNRGLEQRPNKRPVPSDLRDSGEIEEDADAVIFPYRDEVYNEDTPDKGIAEIIVAKNRDGSPGTAICAADMKQSRFTNLNTPFQSQN